MFITCGTQLATTVWSLLFFNVNRELDQTHTRNMFGLLFFYVVQFCVGVGSPLIAVRIILNSWKFVSEQILDGNSTFNFQMQFAYLQLQHCATRLGNNRHLKHKPRLNYRYELSQQIWLASAWRLVLMGNFFHQYCIIFSSDVLRRLWIFQKWLQRMPLYSKRFLHCDYHTRGKGYYLCKWFNN